MWSVEKPEASTQVKCMASSLPCLEILLQRSFEISACYWIFLSSLFPYVLFFYCLAGSRRTSGTTHTRATRPPLSSRTTSLCSTASGSASALSCGKVFSSWLLPYQPFYYVCERIRSYISRPRPRTTLGMINCKVDVFSPTLTVPVIGIFDCGWRLFLEKKASVKPTVPRTHQTVTVSIKLVNVAQLLVAKKQIFTTNLKVETIPELGIP